MFTVPLITQNTSFSTREKERCTGTESEAPNSPHFPPAPVQSGGSMTDPGPGKSAPHKLNEASAALVYGLSFKVDAVV